MHRSVAVVFVALVLLVTASAGTVTVAANLGGTDILTEEHYETELAFQTEHAPPLESATVSDRSVMASETDVRTSQEFDTTRFEITVYEDGTATWTFRYERHLESASEEDDFRAFAEEFESEETDLYERFTEQAHALTETGYDHTDREMDAEEFDRSAGIDHRPSAMGVVEMTFTWTNFAHVDEDGTVTVGDVFDPGIIVMPGQSLTVTAGDDLVFDRTSPDGRYTGSSLETSSSVSWSGEDEFLEVRSIVLKPPDASSGDSNTSPDTDTETGSDRDGALPSDGSNWLVGGLLALLGIGAVAALVWFRFGSREDRPSTATPGPDGARAETDVDTEEGGTETGAGPSTDPGPRGAVPTSAGGTDPPTPIPDEELMTDDDRVVSLIRQNGGRMKQVNIVEETGWSKSKVSMLLSDMEEEETISKLRVGRENIISLEGFEPEATKSPFEE